MSSSERSNAATTTRIIPKNQRNLRGTTTMESRSTSELLEDSGRQRQIKNQELNLHLLSESLFSEQQKLRQVLDWTHTFLSKGSEVHREFCRAESLMLADKKVEKSPWCERLSAAEYQHVSWSADEITSPQNMKSMELLDETIKQTLSRDKRSKSSSKDCTSSYNSSIHPKILKNEVCVEREISEHKVEAADLMFEKTTWTKKNNEKVKTEMKQEKQDSSPRFKLFARKDRARDNLETTQGQREMTSSLSHLKRPQTLIVYEQDQLCVDQLYNLRERRREEPEPVCFIKSPAQEGQTSEQTTPNPGNHKPLDKVKSKTSGNKYTKKQSPDETKDKKKTAELEHGQTKYCDNLRGRVRSKTHLDHDGKKGEKSIKHMTEGKTSAESPVSISVEQVETEADGEGDKQRKKTERKTHQSPTPTEKQTALHGGSASLFTDVDAQQRDQTTYEYYPAGVTVGEHCLSLPGEVWLSILSLLPLRDLCRVMQVCRRLHTLAKDHTLWRHVQVKDSALAEQWFLSVGRRCPRSLSLNSCSGPSLPSGVLEKFFTLCRNTLEEIQVTSCTGPGLQGDQIMSLIGRLCDHVSSVNVSWSGATDAGVKALSECCSGLRLKSVILNGCQVTDGPTIKLIKRHKESLCRLEVFGCQFLTPSVLKTTYEICPNLKHLNIGQVPKVNTDCLTLMTSQLKRLISLNLTGLQAVSDTIVDTLLQSCVELQILILSSCPGVTDLTLHSISRYTPFIRSLDVRGCQAVTDAGVESLAVGCRRLQQLDLSSTKTGNRGVDLLASYSNGHLETVKLSFCHISTENLLKLCRCCKRLKVLHLYGCARVPNEKEIRRVNAAVEVHPLP